MQLTKGKTAKPRRVLLYGTKGIGKSTWANQAGCLFLNLEDGLDNIDCVKTPWLKSFDEVLNALTWICQNPQPQPAIGVDSADWLESLAFRKVAAAAGKNSIDEIGYGKGYQSAADLFTEILNALDYIRLHQGKHVIFLAHEHVTKFSKPGADAYDRYSPALHKETCAVLTEWVDEVLFANYKGFTKTEDLGFKKTRTVALGGASRIITTRETPAIIAKNRLDGIPDEIDMNFATFAAYLPRPAANATALPEGNIAGTIINGHNVKTQETKEQVTA